MCTQGWELLVKPGPILADRCRTEDQCRKTPGQESRGMDSGQVFNTRSFIHQILIGCQALP